MWFRHPVYNSLYILHLDIQGFEKLDKKYFEVMANIFLTTITVRLVTGNWAILGLDQHQTYNQEIIIAS